MDKCLALGLSFPVSEMGTTVTSTKIGWANLTRHGVVCFERIFIEVKVL